MRMPTSWSWREVHQEQTWQEMEILALMCLRTQDMLNPPPANCHHHHHRCHRRHRRCCRRRGCRKGQFFFEFFINVLAISDNSDFLIFIYLLFIFFIFFWGGGV